MQQTFELRFFIVGPDDFDAHHRNDELQKEWSLRWPQESFRDPKFHPIWDHAVLCKDCLVYFHEFLMEGGKLAGVPDLLREEYLNDLFQAQVDAIGRVMVDPDIPNTDVRGMLERMLAAYHLQKRWG